MNYDGAFLRAFSGLFFSRKKSVLDVQVDSKYFSQ